VQSAYCSLPNYATGEPVLGYKKTGAIEVTVEKVFEKKKSSQQNSASSKRNL
jgi:hypothetical protein